MNKFINIRDGRINVSSYRYDDYRATTLEDFISCAVEGLGDYLTADFSTNALCAHPEAGEFLKRYGVRCGTHRGGEVVVLDWDAFILFNDNTVMMDR